MSKHLVASLLAGGRGTGGQALGLTGSVISHLIEILLHDLMVVALLRSTHL